MKERPYDEPMKLELAYWMVAACALSGCVEVGEPEPEPESTEGPDAPPQTSAPHARLFVGGQEGTSRGLHIWNDPDALGLNRAPDVTIEMSAPISVARIGDRLFVLSALTCTSDCEVVLGFFDDPMKLDADAVPTGEIHFRVPAWSDTDRLVAIPELDLVMFEGLVFTGASTLTSEATPVPVSWEHAAYDGATDRLFVSPHFGGQVSVIESASTQPMPPEGGWLLAEGDSIGKELAVDDGRLFAARVLSGSGWRQTVAWALDGIDASESAPYELRVADEAAGAALHQSDITVLHPLSDGVVEGTRDGLVAWSGEAAAAGVASQTGASVMEGGVQSVAVSEDGHVYAAVPNEGVFAFGTEALGETSSSREGVFATLLLVEP